MEYDNKVVLVDRFSKKNLLVPPLSIIPLLTFLDIQALLFSWVGACEVVNGQFERGPVFEISAEQ